MRLIRFRAEANLALLLVGLIVAFVPDGFALPFKGEDVGGDAVQKPAVVADDDGAAAEVEQSVFEGAQRFDVEVVGRLIEQQQVAAAPQQLRQMDAVAFAAGALGDLALLIGALEVEPTRHRPAS